MSEPSKLRKTQQPARSLSNDDFARRMRKRRGEAVEPKAEETADGVFVASDGPEYLPWVPPSHLMTVRALQELADWFGQRMLCLDTVIMPPEMFSKISSEVASISRHTESGEIGSRPMVMHHPMGKMKIIMSSQVKSAAFAWSRR